MTGSMKCPLCGRQKARRACPALGQQICAVCCGTKRMTEIHCPADCPYLATAREHPPAATLRQQQQDLSLVAHMVRDLNRRQSELLFLVLTFVVRYEAQPGGPNASAALGWERTVDVDVSDAASALAATFETASRGLIYEHRPTSRPAGRLMTELKQVLATAGEGGGSSFERDAAIVLRRLEEGVRDVGTHHGSDRRGFLELLDRVISRMPDESGSPSPESSSRLIVP